MYVCSFVNVTEILPETLWEFSVLFQLFKNFSRLFFWYDLTPEFSDLPLCCPFMVNDYRLGLVHYLVANLAHSKAKAGVFAICW